MDSPLGRRAILTERRGIRPMTYNRPMDATSPAASQRLWSRFSDRWWLKTRLQRLPHRVHGGVFRAAQAPVLPGAHHAAHGPGSASASRPGASSSTAACGSTSRWCRACSTPGTRCGCTSPGHSAELAGLRHLPVLAHGGTGSGYYDWSAHPSVAFLKSELDATGNSLPFPARGLRGADRGLAVSPAEIRRMRPSGPNC